MGERNPWGTNAHSALRWSFGLLARSASSTNVFGEMTGGTKRRTEMTMLDHRAQGAIIRKIVEERLRVSGHTVELAYIVAYYLPKPTKERVAGGGTELIDRYLGDRQAAVYAVAWWLLGQEGTGQHTIRGFMEIVAQYTLQRSSLRRLARMMRMHVNNAKAAKEAAHGKLETLHERALFLAEQALVETGLIEVERDDYQMG